MPESTPPQITTGSFVSWDGGEGRVDLIVTTGEVPGVQSDVEATADSPAARVAVWRDGKPTGDKIAASTHTLRRIAPLDKAETKSDPMAALVDMQRQHEEADGLPETAALSGEAIKTAYERGVMSWPGADVTALTPTDWGLGRADHLCKTARGEAEVTNDPDLLAATHPLAVAETKTGNATGPHLHFDVTDDGGVAVAEPAEQDGDGDDDEFTGEISKAEVDSMIASIAEQASTEERGDTED